MPGIAIRDHSPDGSQIQDVQLSRLIGPPLDVPISRALDMLRVSFENYYEKLAVASMYQPADYLAPIFEHDAPSAPPGWKDGEERNYLRWSYGQLRHAGELLAASLASRGVRSGQTITALIHGGVDFYIIFYATLVLRCRFSPMNYSTISNAAEISSMLATVEAKAICTISSEEMNKLVTNAPDFASDETVKFVLEKPKDLQANGHVAHFEYIEDMIVGALPIEAAEEILEPFESLVPDPEDDALVIFTSGTSSLPKACPLSNKMVTSIATAYGRGPASGPTAVTCSHLPIYHIAGCITGGWNPLANGGGLVHPAPAFTGKSTVEAIRLEGVTFMVLVPSMIGLLLGDPSLPPPDQMSIQNISLGASTILYTDVEKCYEYLGAKRVITSYAMTEGLMMTRGHLPREPTEAAINGIQRIAAGTRLKICAPNSTTPLPRGEAGEVHQGGASTIRGYIGKESDNFYEDDDGKWCKTGDQAIMHSDGGIQITGRYKDLIIRGGVNISPQSIEGVISKILHMEAHVVGMPDSIAGEVPVAVVRDADMQGTSLAKLREPIVRELGPKFALEKFVPLSELDLKEFPKTSTGKIRKVDLQAAIRTYAQKKNGAGEASTTGKADSRPRIEQLMEIWAEIAGVDPEDVTPETSVQDMADSLMLSRYATTVRQAFGVPFTLADLEKYVLLSDQAALLDERAEADSSNVDLHSDREGPPAASEIVHVGEDDDEFAHTRRQVENVLHPMGFNWDDVQDVSTPSQWLQSWVKSRETSDRFRAAYIATEADTGKLANAIEETLRRNDSLRGISVPAGDGSDFQVILRHTEKWVHKVITIQSEPVKTLRDLERCIPPDFQLNHGLVKVVVAHVEETNTAGLALMTLHTTFDAFSLNIMRNDLNYLLNGKKPKQHVPYKLWMDHLFNQRDAAQARAAIKYNVKRLRGIGQYRAALWPPQRTPVWQRGVDRGLHITYKGQITTPDDPDRRPVLDGKMAIGSRGLRRDTKPIDMAVLASTHRIPAPIIIKAALVLLTTRLTGQDKALFTQTFAMRDDWPFIDEWMSRRLPSPLEVTGPALARIAEMVPIQHNQSVLDWMVQMKAEQDVLIRHAHAPYRHVFDRLNAAQDQTSTIAGTHSLTNGYTNGVQANGEPKPIMARKEGHRRQSASQNLTQTRPASWSHTRTGSGGRQRSYTTTYRPILEHPEPEKVIDHYLPNARDGEVMESVRRRINFQWLPIFQNDKKVKNQIRLSSSSHFNEVGLAVKAGMLEDHQTLWLKMEWDDGNIRQGEAKAWIDEMIKYVDLLGDEKNWTKSVGDLYSAAGL